MSQQLIYEHLQKNRGKPFTTKELAETLNIAKNKTSLKMKKLDIIDKIEYEKGDHRYREPSRIRLKPS